MVKLVNRAYVNTSTTGTGTITLGSPLAGQRSFADAGVNDGDTVRYIIEDGNNWEIGTGTYTASGTTLSRTVSESSNSDAAINLSGSAYVYIGATDSDFLKAVDVTPSSGTYTLDLASANVFELGSINTSSTVLLSNDSGGVNVFLVSFVYGGGTITFSGNVQISYGTVFVPGYMYTVSFVRSTGSTYTGSITQISENTSLPFLIGHASSTAVNGSDATVDLTTISLQENDFLLAFVGVGHDATVDSVSITSSGWTQLVNEKANGTEDALLGVWYKIMGATPDTSFAAGGTADTGDSCAVTVRAYRNVNTTTPIDVTPTVNIITNSALADPPSITTVTDNSLIVFAGVAAHTQSADVILTHTAQRVVFLSADDTSDVAMTTAQLPAILSGSYDPDAFSSFNLTDTTSFSSVAATIALRGAT